MRYIVSFTDTGGMTSFRNYLTDIGVQAETCSDVSLIVDAPSKPSLYCMWVEIKEKRLTGLIEVLK